MRMVQGFSVGGEFTGSMTYATEAAPPGQQGLLASLATAGGLVGFSLGSLTVALLARSLGNAAMDAWGWRLAEVRQQGPLVLRIIALVSFANVVFYVLFVYLVDYSAHQPGSSLAQANTTSTVIQTLGLPLVLLGGVLADRWGKLQVNRLGTLLLALVTPIALPVVQLAGPSGLVMGQLLGVLPVMMSMGGQGVLAVEWVPVRQRCTVFSIAYSLAMALFAGTAPVVCSWLLEEQGWQWGPALYCCLFALPAWWALKGQGPRTMNQGPRPSPRSGGPFCHQPPARR